MPHLTKEALSQYVRTECRKQLRLYLSPSPRCDGERAAQGMPDPQPPRPGLEQFTQAGEEWQAEKMNDLTVTFGAGAVEGTPFAHASGQTRYRETPLRTLLPRAAAHRFVAEAQFEIGPTFERALGIDGHRTRFSLTYADVRPDLIQVLAPLTCDTLVLPNGDTRAIPAGDTRLQLRVIDIKLTAEPSPSYFAEVAYYTMALAGWLTDSGLDGQYVVVPTAAVWPGSHDASSLAVTYRRLTASGAMPTPTDLHAALGEDLELAPFEVFALRVRRFLQVDVPGVLGQRWDAIDFHVDNRCKNCEYLGYPWVNARGVRTDLPAHCMPTAERDEHVSRVAYVSRGARIALDVQGVSRVSALAALPPGDPVYDAHQVLRATRTVVAGRAQALGSGVPHVPAASGTSAVMPRWADLRIHLSVDYDLGSAITFAFGIKASWIEPHAYGAPPNPARRWCRWGSSGRENGVVGTPQPPGSRYRPIVLPVDQRDTAVERRELLAFLQRIHTILTEAQTLHPDTTVQVYLWDALQYDHLTRVIGRHLDAVLRDQTIQHLAWLFPPEQLLPSHQATRLSPITLVRDVVRCLVAAPVAHYYSLLEIARTYHSPTLPAGVATFSVHPLFEDALSDQIPSERAHEIWSRVTTGRRHWRTQLDTLVQTVERRLDALDAVRGRLQEDLAAHLHQDAPPIRVGPPARVDRLSFDSQLWYAFAKLDGALSQIEVQTIRAMPPHEREARFHSARLTRRLAGPSATAAAARAGVTLQPGWMVYEMSPGSREVKVREGDFDVALAPESRPGFLDEPLQLVTRGSPLEPSGGSGWQIPMGDACGVSVQAVDRDNCVIVLAPGTRFPTMIADLEAHGIADFAADVVLDHVYKDFFAKKLLATLREIGNPPAARNDPLVRRAIGQTAGAGSRRSRTDPPPADFLWGAAAMNATPVAARVLPPVRTALETAGIRLNATQWQAWEQSLSRRLQLIWGPPGTGKSETARAVILGAILDAHLRGVPLQVLVCASTYSAMDNVLLGVNARLSSLLPAGGGEVTRLRSYLRPPEATLPPGIDVVLNRHRPAPAVVALRDRLQRHDAITVVGATPEQVHNLLTCDGDPPVAPWFDLILIDEASQMDVGHAVLPLAALADGGSVVLAGDHMQLPPIHQAEPPAGLEAMVGSVYTFCRGFHGVPEVMLDVNYRSNRALVDFARHAGYRSSLASHSPDLRLNLLSPAPTSPPPGWPAHLYWTPEWAALLDPARPAVCFVYPEGRSSQWNQFEADAVAALTWLLHGRVGDQLLDERDALTGAVRPAGATPYTPARFWEQAIGVVTPHRAQQGLVVTRLQQVFVPAGIPPAAIRGAVDTVERFQGQQRDVIIASFALGDPDAIGEEDEFLMSLRRFNVMASRARAKLIVFVSREVVDHLAAELDVLRDSRLLKVFAESYCDGHRPMTLGYLEAGTPQLRGGEFRYPL
jgi:DNA replication ATP-dependent helicase Dna2